MIQQGALSVPRIFTMTMNGEPVMVLGAKEERGYARRTAGSARAQPAAAVTARAAMQPPQI